jgi:hypothetical protein
MDLRELGLDGTSADMGREMHMLAGRRNLYRRGDSRDNISGDNVSW